MIRVLKGISPIAAIFGMPKTESTPRTVKASARITNKETIIVPIHPDLLPFQNRYVKTKVRIP